MRKDGTLLNALFNCRISRGFQRFRTHCIFLDVTKHLGDAKALQKNAEILREMEGQGRIGFWEADLAGGRMYWSEEIFRLLDLDPAPGFLDLAESLERFGDRGAELQGCLLRVRDSQAREEQTYLVRLASGRQAWLHLDVNPAWNERGEVNRIFGTVQDITERKKLEEELTRQNFELTQKNIALRELIDQVQHEKKIVEERIAENVQRLLMPLLARIKERTLAEDRALYQLLESTIRELVPMADTELNGAMRKLSPRETEVSLMIRNGLSSKEIGKLLGLSIRSVETHRNNIRKKLGIGGSRGSLLTFLRSQRSSDTT
jgi:DNA-binding CsgD family transcriptional regulator